MLKQIISYKCKLWRELLFACGYDITRDVTIDTSDLTNRHVGGYLGTVNLSGKPWSQITTFYLEEECNKMLRGGSNNQISDEMLRGGSNNQISDEQTLRPPEETEPEKGGVPF
jgi:hypothetical protein